MATLSESQRSVFAAAYRFYEKYHDMPNDDTHWQELAHEVGDVYASNKCPLALHLLTAVIDTIEDRCKAEQAAKQEVSTGNWFDPVRPEPKKSEQMVMTDEHGRAVNF